MLAVVVLRADLPVYDDAFFFRRFALNLWEHGVWAWNVEDGAVYGNTSQLWQGVVTLLAGLTTDHTMFLGRLVLASSLCFSGFALLRRRDPLPTLFALLSPIGLATVFSGMETALVLALGASLLCWRRAAGPLTVLLFLARPDTLLLALPTLALRRQWRHLAGAVVGVLLFMGLFWWGYGTPVPLSAWLKTGQTELYDPTFLAASARAGSRHLTLFALVAAPLVLWGRRSLWLLPAALFVAFHALVTVDVMGLHARFYAPALPWLVMAARPQRTRRELLLLGLWALGVGVAVLQGWVPREEGWSLGRIPDPVWLAMVLAPFAGMLRPWLMPPLVVLGLLAPIEGLPQELMPKDRQLATSLRREVTSWRGLPQARRCLGDELHVFHSEIGVPGVFFERVTDLGGLMNEEVLLGGLSFEELCLRDQPDLIFLPHRNYASLNQAILQGRCIQGYGRVVEKGSSPLYVRRDRLQDYDCR